MMEDEYSQYTTLKTPTKLTRFDQSTSMDIGGGASGWYWIVASKSDGSVWGWGPNNNGQLGDGTKDNNPMSVQVIDIYSQTGFLNLGTSLPTGPTTTTTWYLDADGDGYGDPAVSMDFDSQPVGYLSDNTDCDDSDPTVHPGATEIAGYGIDQDCDGNDNLLSVEQVYLLSPTDNKTMGYGSTTGQVSFSFSKISGASKYMLYLKMNDILNNIEFPISVELIPPGSGNNITTFASPGFSESFMGMFYNLSLDQVTWDAMSLYSIKWGVEAYNDSGELIGSTYELSVPAKYGNDLKLLASSAITMTSPTPGQELSKANPAPTFQWDTYQGVSTYTFILAHQGSFGFDTIIDKPGLTLNISPMDDPTWQSMPTGRWYWTVLGSDSFGAPKPQDFTIFHFEVKD
jgi:hypothetical protein